MTELEVLLNRKYLSQESGVSDSTRKILASGDYTEEVTFDGDTVLVEEGQPFEGLYLTLDGLFHVTSKENPTHSNRLVGKIERAEFIGEVSMIEGSGHASATVTAKENARALRMTAEEFGRLQKDHPSEALEFTLALARQLCKRLRVANAKLL